MGDNGALEVFAGDVEDVGVVDVFMLNVGPNNEKKCMSFTSKTHMFKLVTDSTEVTF